MNIYIMVGYSGSGKSTTAKRIQKNSRRETEIIEIDKILETAWKNGLTCREAIKECETAIYKIILKSCISQNSNIDYIIDGCHLSVRSRAKLIETISNMLNKLNKKICLKILFIAVVVKTSKETSYIRKYKRDKITKTNEKIEYNEEIVKNREKIYTLEIPTLEEGFYSIITIPNEETA